MEQSASVPSSVPSGFGFGAPTGFGGSIFGGSPSVIPAKTTVAKRWENLSHKIYQIFHIFMLSAPKAIQELYWEKSTSASASSGPTSTFGFSSSPSSKTTCKSP